MKLCLFLIATVFGRYVKEGGKCFHYHGSHKHEVKQSQCGPTGQEDICESIPHAGSNGCPLELEDFYCDGTFCMLDVDVGGATWDGSSHYCGCKTRFMSQADIIDISEYGDTYVGVGGDAASDGKVFSSKYDFCYQKCMGLIPKKTGYYKQ